MTNEFISPTLLAEGMATKKLPSLTGVETSMMPKGLKGGSIYTYHTKFKSQEGNGYLTGYFHLSNTHLDL